MKHIKKFSESNIDKKKLHRVSHEIDGQKIEEGVKEWILSGALALATAGGVRAQKSDNVLNQPKNKEYVQSQSKDTLKVIDFGSEFESGTYKFSEDKKIESENKLNQITDFVKKFNGRHITISIEGSESLVPNIDKETGKRLPKGGLAKMRVAEVQDLIESHLESLIGKGVFNGTYDTTTRIGTTPYATGEEPGQEKFTKEQYVRVTIKVGGEIKGKDAFASYAQMGNRIFNQSNKKAVGDIYFRTTSTSDIRDAGSVNTGYEDAVLKTLIPEKDWAEKQSNKNLSKQERENWYDGHAYLIPYQWINNVSTSRSWPEDEINNVISSLEVNTSSGKYKNEDAARKWYQENKLNPNF